MLNVLTSWYIQQHFPGFADRSISGLCASAQSVHFSFFGHAADYYVILVPRPGIEPITPAFLKHRVLITGLSFFFTSFLSPRRSYTSFFSLGPYPMSFVSLGQNLAHVKSSINDQINRWMALVGPGEKTSDEQKKT